MLGSLCVTSFLVYCWLLAEPKSVPVLPAWACRPCVLNVYLASNMSSVYALLMVLVITALGRHVTV